MTRTMSRQYGVKPSPSPSPSFHANALVASRASPSPDAKTAFVFGASPRGCHFSTNEPCCSFRYNSTRERAPASVSARWNSADSNHGTVMSAHPASRYAGGKHPGATAGSGSRRDADDADAQVAECTYPACLAASSPAKEPVGGPGGGARRRFANNASRAVSVRSVVSFAASLRSVSVTPFVYTASAATEASLCLVLVAVAAASAERASATMSPTEMFSSVSMMPMGAQSVRRMKSPLLFSDSEPVSFCSSVAAASASFAALGDTETFPSSDGSSHRANEVDDRSTETAANASGAARTSRRGDARSKPSFPPIARAIVDTSATPRESSYA
mmetsp:Transcript_9835/g.41834  ORF Transcript_9835/g.41834 Transcript_9835/m.41834 type:complete len:330 (-) Transcript_9835:956-1945(-)